MKINQKKASYPLRKIAFLAIPLALGFTLGSCQENEDTSVSTSTPSVGTYTTSSTSPEASPQSDPFQEALNAGMDAANFAGLALYKADWQIVNERWKKAIKLLETVPEDNENYDLAQRKITEYKKNADIAATKAQQSQQQNSPQTSTSSPSVSTSPTSSPSPESPDKVLEKFCIDVQPTEFNQPLELNKIRIDDDLPEDPNRLVLPSDSESKSSIIGCVTNHTDKPVNVSSMTFTFNETGWGATSIQIPVDKIQPGQTVAFWVSGIILTNMESIVIRSIDYSFGELQTEIEVRR